MIKSFKNFNLIVESRKDSDIDLTLIDPSYSKQELINLCQEAIKTKPYSICTLPKYLHLIKELVIDTDILLCVVVDFPLGDSTFTQKIKETKEVINKGIDECEMVIDYKKIQKLENLENEQYDKLYNTIKKPIKEFGKLCRKNNIITKVIIETGILTLSQIKIALNILIECNINYVMTSTGYTEIGAEESKVKFMNNIIPNSKLKIKVSGGIRSHEDIKKFKSHGAKRFGTSTIL